MNKARGITKKYSFCEFKNRLKTKCLDIYNNIEFIGEYINLKTKILAKCKYGYVNVVPEQLLDGCHPTIRKAIDKHSFYFNQLKDKNPVMYNQIKNGEIEVLNKYKGCFEYIHFNTKYGEVKLKPSSLSQGVMYNINSAVDSQKYFLNKAKELHGDKFDYSNVQYIDMNKKIDIKCREHNSSFQQTPSQHIRAKSGCVYCQSKNLSKRNQDNTDSFIKKAIERHGNLYKYDKVEYKDSYTKVSIYCRVHNKYFLMMPNTHLSGGGCQSCASGLKNLTMANRKKDEWSKIPSYLYIMNIYSDEESFYKIGVAKKGVDHRYNNGKRLPIEYSYEKILELKTNQYVSVILENELLIKLNDLKYIPNKKFTGWTECVLRLDDLIIEDIINNWIEV